MSIENEKPLLLKSLSQNGGATVQYKGRFLYSKYDPQKNIASQIEKTQILPGTLIFAFSPCLFYGLEELKKKCGEELGKSVFVVAVEAEEELRNLKNEDCDFSKGVLIFPNELFSKDGTNLFLKKIAGELEKDFFGKKDALENAESFAGGGSNETKNVFKNASEEKKSCGKKNASGTGGGIETSAKNNANDFCDFCGFGSEAKNFFSALPAPGTFRRALRLDFSGGVFFNAEFYERFFFAAQNAISQFWKNRLTLVKLGRLYCKNIFKNIVFAAKSVQFETLKKSVEKPIFVFGAGESLEKSVAFFNAVFFKKDFFVIAVDAAALPLLVSKIKVDAIVANESQIAIEKAYVGIKNAANFLEKKPLLFCDLTSRHTIPRLKNFEPCFFFSEFQKSNFTSRLKNAGVLPALTPPLGSVGITAVFLATLLRKSCDIPIFVSGLDFSFSLGKTHANGTFFHAERLQKNSRLFPIANFDAAFSLGAEKIFSENGGEIFTAKNLLGYAKLFKDFFREEKNIFLNQGGLDLGFQKWKIENEKLKIFSLKNPIEKIEAEFFFQRENSFFKKNDGKNFVEENSPSEKKIAPPPLQKNERTKKALAFLQNEKSALRELSDILSNGENSQFRKKNLSYSEQIFRLLECREYLYLHFADGAAAKIEASFLNRVKVQIGFFEKEIEVALKRGGNKKPS